MKLTASFSLLFVLTSTGIFLAGTSRAQVTISGTVYDSSKLYVVPNVTIVSSSGNITKTDSLGAYHISANLQDSISFIYEGKATVQFPVKTIPIQNAFDISIRVKIKDKYKLLKGVTVYSSTYQQDSIENRQEYAKIFDRSGVGIRSNFDPGGAAGLDLDALIGVFNFRKNKQNLAFQQRLIQEEQEKYVNYRFNSTLLKRVTGLSGDTLLRYKQLYRPSYDFVSMSTLTEFYTYILNTSYAFKRQEGIGM